MFFRMVTEKNTKEWKKVPMINQIDAHLLANELNEKIDIKRFQEIKRLTSVHKLTYKGLERKENSYLSYLDKMYMKE